MPFRSTTIRTKLVATFAVVTLFILAIGMLGLSGVDRINGLLTAVQTNWLPSVRTSGEIDVSMARYTTSLLRATQTTDAGDLAIDRSGSRQATSAGLRTVRRLRAADQFARGTGVLRYVPT